MENKPILKRGENPSVVLHEFVKRTFKEEMKVDIVFISNFYYSAEIRVRITLPNGIFWEEDGRNKKAAKRNAAKYIIEHWGDLDVTEWTPKEGFWSLNDSLHLQSNNVNGKEYLIDNDNCFINKPIAYWVAGEIKDLLLKYKSEDNNWSPEIGETYYYVMSDLSRVSSSKAYENSFWGRGEYHANNKFRDKKTAEEFLEGIKKIFKEGRDLSSENWKDGGTCYEIDCYHKMAQDRAETKRMIKSLY